MHLRWIVTEIPSEGQVIYTRLISSAWMLAMSDWGSFSPNDCDDTSIVAFPNSYDLDGDGYGICEDCFDLGGDSNQWMNPGAAEVCGDALDNDCDGAADNVDLDGDGSISTDCDFGDDCDDTDDQVNPDVDADGDNYDVCLDCDDEDNTAFPGAPEICDDGVDQNCTGEDRLGDLDADTYSSLACGGLNDPPRFRARPVPWWTTFEQFFVDGPTGDPPTFT